MSIEEDNKQLVKAFFEKSAAGDVEGAFSMYSPDVKAYVLGSTPVSGTHRGLQEMMEKLGPALAELPNGVTLTLDEMIAEGDWVVALGRGHATTARGNEYNNTYVWFYRIQDGKFVETKEFADTVMVETAIFGKRLVEE